MTRKWSFWTNPKTFMRTRYSSSSRCSHILSFSQTPSRCRVRALNGRDMRFSLCNLGMFKWFFQTHGRVPRGSADFFQTHGSCSKHTGASPKFKTHGSPPKTHGSDFFKTPGNFQNVGIFPRVLSEIFENSPHSCSPQKFRLKLVPTRITRFLHSRRPL